MYVVEDNAGRYAAFDAANAALAASGTVTSELALARTPMVVGYRLGWLTYALARPFVHVPYIVLANLVLQRQAVPEFVQRLARLSACQSAEAAVPGHSSARDNS